MNYKSYFCTATLALKTVAYRRFVVIRKIIKKPQSASDGII